MGDVQGEATSLAGEPPGPGEETSFLQGLGFGHHWLAQADATGPEGEIVGDDLRRQPGGVGGEASLGQVVSATGRRPSSEVWAPVLLGNGLDAVAQTGRVDAG